MLPLMVIFGVLTVNFLHYKHVESSQLTSATAIVSKLLVGYNREDPPKAGSPTEVKIGYHINGIYSINEKTMDYTINMYLRQQWRDPRLDFRHLNENITRVRMATDSWNHIWVPDTFFRNEKEASFHEVTVKNRMLKLQNDGTVWYVAKVTATLSCPMNLQAFPFDIQTCPITLESFGYTMETMYFSWMNNLDIEDGLMLPKFALVDYILFDCSQNYTSGSYPCLEARLVLKRDVGYFLIQVYLPSMLIVILSWMSFWINVDASAARVLLGLFTVIMTTTISGGARSSLPKVSYIKAIDIWTISCMVFVLSSLIEYAVVNVLSRRPPTTSCAGGRLSLNSLVSTIIHRRRRHSNDDIPMAGCQEPPRATSNVKDSSPSQQERQVGSETMSDSRVSDNVTLIDGKTRARNVDRLARICFPLAFILFSFVYFMCYVPSK